MAFVKGQSGNPGGRPADHVLKDCARAQTVPAIQTLVSVMNNKKSPAASRVAAASALLDRGWGKPGLTLDVSGDGARTMLGTIQVLFVNASSLQIDQAMLEHEIEKSATPSAPLPGGNEAPLIPVGA